MLRDLFELRSVEEREYVDGMVGLLRRWAANRNYRSAAVEELVIEQDFCRRPLRPEDLEFIDFSQRLSVASLTTLYSLACNRALLCINESDLLVPADLLKARRKREHDEFYGEKNRLVGRLLRPWLEDLVFGAVEEEAAALSLSRSDVGPWWDAAWRELVEREDVLGRVASDGIAARMQVLQNAGVAITRIRAVRRGYGAIASCQPVAACTVPNALCDLEAVDWPALLSEVRLSSHPHAHWQFYLPTTLAWTNFLYRAGGDPLRWFQFQGAAAYFVLEMLTVLSERAMRGEVAFSCDAAAGWARSLPAQVEGVGRYGEDAEKGWFEGFSAGRMLRRARDIDLWDQMMWLSEIERYSELARSFDERIRRAELVIDRETFVEPREMCSTTHVHDDHRLVVIERGDMMFWGAPGMNARLAEGEMILIPRGRLHGSAVEALECTYHQPIIPETWVRNELKQCPWKRDIRDTRETIQHGW